MDNQTEEQWLMYVSAYDRGTGLFASTNLDAVQVAAAPHPVRTINTIDALGIPGPISKIIVSEITYQTCVKVGYEKGVIAFKWIPLLMAGEDTVIESTKACGLIQCVKRCAGYGCLCLTGTCK